MQLWTAIEVRQVRPSADGIVAEIEHTKAAQRRPEVLRRKDGDLVGNKNKFILQLT